MTVPGFPGLWDRGFWDNNYLWDDVPTPPDPPDDTDYDDVAATHSIEFSVTLRLEEEIAWSPPPAQVYPLRNYRTVMGDYRITQGIPVTPPTLDCAVPVLVSVDPKGVAVPSATRPLPKDIATMATLRWYADGGYINSDSTFMQWWDTTGLLCWTSYDDWQPLLDDDYDYLIPRPNNAEVVAREALVFDSALGTNMSASMSINQINNATDVEFFFVLWTHPLLTGQQFSAVLDNGQAIQGFHDLPYIPGDSVTGKRQEFHRYPDKLAFSQDDYGLPLYWTQVSGAGRPVLYRVRFGVHPLIEVWGPSNGHMRIAGTVQKQEPLCADYVLGRVFNLVSSDTNGGMHLFEVNYYDHMLSDTDAATVVAAFNSCYAISS